MRTRPALSPRPLRGLLLVDVLVGVAVIGTVLIGLYGAFQAAVAAVTVAKGEAGAVAVVSSEMEYVRGLPYADVGVVGGTPAGVMPAFSIRTQNGVPYSLVVAVSYVDDPADGAGANDQDGIVNDYKKIIVTATWPSRSGTASVSSVSYVAPPGVETASP